MAISTNGSGYTCSLARIPSTAGPTRSSAISSPSVCSACPGRFGDEHLREDHRKRRMTLSIPPKEIDGHGLLNGKVVVVTAAAGTGIGSSTARRALLEGADVVISDHHERRLGETRDQLMELGLGRVESVVCDVTSTAQVDALIASTTLRMGRLDVLVNNAGLGGQTPVADMTDDEWDRVLNVTLTSVMRATRAVLRYFREADHGGTIVNNASV